MRAAVGNTVSDRALCTAGVRSFALAVQQLLRLSQMVFEIRTLCVAVSPLVWRITSAPPAFLHPTYTLSLVVHHCLQKLWAIIINSLLAPCAPSREC